jgi:hypothetical protein
LLDDAALRQRLQEGCAEAARELGWAEPLDQTEALYAILTSRKKNSGSPAPVCR